MEWQRSGSYKGAKKRGYKVAGLSESQMKRATTLKGKKVSASQAKKASVLKDIGETKWEKGKGVVGPGGKAFTGSVLLASGKTAAYSKGRRIGVQAKKPSGSSTATGSRSTGSRGLGNAGTARGTGSKTPPANTPPPGTNQQNKGIRGLKAAKRQDRSIAGRSGTKPRTVTPAAIRERKASGASSKQERATASRGGTKPKAGPKQTPAQKYLDPATWAKTWRSKSGKGLMTPMQKRKQREYQQWRSSVRGAKY